MGTEGMRASLVSRDLIADSIELVVRGHLFDGLVCIVGCDKTIPAAVMALARLDLPGLVFYNGSIAPGRFRGRDVTIQDVFEAIGAHAAGTMSEGELHALESAACPGAGACGGQFTANTMATVLDFLGVSAPGLNEVPATHPGKPAAAVAAGKLAVKLVREEGGRRRCSRARRSRTRSLDRRDRRLDERRPPPARDRARGGRRSRRWTTSTRSRAARRSSSTSSRPVASSRPISTAPAVSRSSRASSSARERCTAMRAASTAVRSREVAESASERRARRSSCPGTSR